MEVTADTYLLHFSGFVKLVKLSKLTLKVCLSEKTVTNILFILYLFSHIVKVSDYNQICDVFLVYDRNLFYMLVMYLKNDRTLVSRNLLRLFMIVRFPANHV